MTAIIIILAAAGFATIAVLMSANESEERRELARWRREDLRKGIHVTIYDGNKYLYNRKVTRLNHTHVWVLHEDNPAVHPVGNVYPLDYFNDDKSTKQIGFC
jgi:hypothetical protein